VRGNGGKNRRQAGGEGIIGGEAWAIGKRTRSAGMVR
jgi:hypothetical protein